MVSVDVLLAILRPLAPATPHLASFRVVDNTAESDSIDRGPVARFVPVRGRNHEWAAFDDAGFQVGVATGPMFRWAALKSGYASDREGNLIHMSIASTVA